jgi:hypothetical protein
MISGKNVTTNELFSFGKKWKFSLNNEICEGSLTRLRENSIFDEFEI